MTNIFWPWQNDYEPKVNRHFIREALITATEMAAEELGLEDRPDVDHDTKGVPGMADIAATILNKIAECAVFVADVTPIAKTAAGKALPPIPPDLAVEVVSPSNRPGEIAKKVREYLAVGTLLVWVVYPERRTVVMHRPGQAGTITLGDADTIENLPELPGFRCPVADFFL